MLVRPLDPDDVRALHTVRATLEGLLVREACDRLTAEDEAELGDCFNQMKLLVDHPIEHLRLAGRFHERGAGPHAV